MMESIYDIIFGLIASFTAFAALYMTYRQLRAMRQPNAAVPRRPEHAMQQDTRIDLESARTGLHRDDGGAAKHAPPALLWPHPRYASLNDTTPLLSEFKLATAQQPLVAAAAAVMNLNLQAARVRWILSLPVFDARSNGVLPLHNAHYTAHLLPVHDQAIFLPAPPWS